MNLFVFVCGRMPCWSAVGEETAGLLTNWVNGVVHEINDERIERRHATMTHAQPATPPLTSVPPMLFCQQRRSHYKLTLGRL